MIANGAVVADMIAAPQDHVVADPSERLQHIVLEDETVLTDRSGVVDTGRVHEAREAIAPLLAFQVFRHADGIELLVAEWTEQRDRSWSGGFFERFPGMDWQAPMHIRLTILLVNSKADDPASGLFKIDARNIRNLARAEDDDGESI